MIKGRENRARRLAEGLHEQRKTVEGMCLGERTGSNTDPPGQMLLTRFCRRLLQNRGLRTEQKQMPALEIIDHVVWEKPDVGCLDVELFHSGPFQTDNRIE